MTALATIVVAILILDVGLVLGCWWASDARRWDEVDR